MAPKLLPPELLYETVRFVLFNYKIPNAFVSCRMLHDFLLPRAIKWAEILKINMEQLKYENDELKKEMAAMAAMIVQKDTQNKEMAAEIVQKDTQNKEMAAEIDSLKRSNGKQAKTKVADEKMEETMEQSSVAGQHNFVLPTLPPQLFGQATDHHDNYEPLAKRAKISGDDSNEEEDENELKRFRGRDDNIDDNIGGSQQESCEQLDPLELSEQLDPSELSEMSKINEMDPSESSEQRKKTELNEMDRSESSEQRKKTELNEMDRSESREQRKMAEPNETDKFKETDFSSPSRTQTDYRLSDQIMEQRVWDAGLAILPFLHASVTPFHAVEWVEKLLKSEGFVQKFEHDKLQVRQKQCFYVKMNKTSIFAFAVGGAFQPFEAGFTITVAHTDSPCLRIKPVSKKTAEQYLQVDVSPYGGGLWRTWLDRELSAAGHVEFCRPESFSGTSVDARIQHKLIDLRRPLFYIPSFASDSGLVKDEFNKETHLTPIIAHTVICEQQQTNNKKDKEDDNGSSSSGGGHGGGTDSAAATNCQRFMEKHHAQLLEKVADAAGCQPEHITNMEMFLYDTHPATPFGLNKEFITGARLESLLSTYATIKGLIESLDDTDSFQADTNVRVVACFDNTEVDVQQSHFFESLLRNILSSADHPSAFECSIGRSFTINTDQANAVHPNHAQKHEQDRHEPAFHCGIVVKVDQNLANTAYPHSVLKEIAGSVNVPLQIRDDSRCGSTFGPRLAANLGIQYVTVGCPMLAKHAVREICDLSSISQSIRLFSGFFSKLPKVLKCIKKTGE